MSFLSILWLSALATLAVPVILHLIRSGRPRRVRLGTIRLLRESSRVRARRWRPSQLLLMLVRCLLLAALALVLAEPRGWPGAGVTDQGVILVSPRIIESADEAAAVLRTRITNLEADGHQVRPLAPGDDVWSLLRQAEAEIEPGRPLFVFADGASLLRGARPSLRRAVEWSALAMAERAGTGRPLADASHGNPTNSQTTVRAAVYFVAEREDDAHYLLAALEAACEHLGLDLNASPTKLEGDGPSRFTNGDLAVWLSPTPVPQAVLASSRWILSDGLDRHESCQRKIYWRDWDIDLRRCSPAEAVPGEAVLWSDGSGRALLTASHHSQRGLSSAGIWLRFQGRFHPRWSNLVLTPAFPQGVAELLTRALLPAVAGRQAGLRIADVRPEQAKPRVNPTDFDLTASEAASAIGSSAPEGRGIELLLWLVVAGFFALERGMVTLAAERAT